jgi:putative transposase
MDRLLRQHGGDRRPARHPPGPGQAPTAGRQAEPVLSWDRTKLAGPARWTWDSLDVILDVYSRSVVGWMVAYRPGRHAGRAAAGRHDHRPGCGGWQAHRACRPGHLDDRQAGRHAAERPGGDQVALPPARPRRQPLLPEPVQDPKHHPTFPDRFGCLQDARSFCHGCFGWYNFEHHWGVGLLTPADVHLGRAEQITLARGAVLEGAYAAHPQRFVRKPPVPPRLPQAVWINKPLDPTERLSNFPADLSHRG